MLGLSEFFLTQLQDICSVVPTVRISAETWILTHFLAPRLESLCDLPSGARLELVRRGKGNQGIDGIAADDGGVDFGYVIERAPRDSRLEGELLTDQFGFSVIARKALVLSGTKEWLADAEWVILSADVGDDFSAEFADRFRAFYQSEPRILLTCDSYELIASAVSSSDRKVAGVIPSATSPSSDAILDARGLMRLEGEFLMKMRRSLFFRWNQKKVESRGLLNDRVFLGKLGAEIFSE